MKKITGERLNETLFLHSFLVDELEQIQYGQRSTHIISVKDRNGKEFKFKGCRNYHQSGKHIHKYFKIKTLSMARLREWFYMNKADSLVEQRGPYHVTACNILLENLYSENGYVFKYAI
mgnify:CR=1 FL=1